MINIVLVVVIELLVLKRVDSASNCADGYFPVNETCLHCPITCLLCTSEYNCTVCKNGLKGRTCIEECVNCQPGTPCDRIEGYCYLGCKDGLGGSKCNQSCNPNCTNCYRNDTNKCETCAPNRFGRECNFLCPRNCYQQMCDQRNGHCQNVCTEGYWGNKCDYACPRRCKNNVCDVDNGTCTKGCVGNYEGNKCLCPLGCSCDTTGECMSCTAESGIVCDERCSDGCVGKFCKNKTRVCLEGCINGYSDERCNKDEGNAENRLIGLVGLVVVPVIFIGIILCIYCKQRNSIQENGTSDTLNDHTEDPSTLAPTRVENLIMDETKKLISNNYPEMEQNDPQENAQEQGSEDPTSRQINTQASTSKEDHEGTPV